jgi:PhzF family phenazine biosynthesis protein
VFTETPFGGNPVAVVLDSDGLTTGEMQRFAHWTNLSETTFVSPPSSAEADYRVRIFTPSRELPFAGHPTLGTCHAWLEAGGKPALPEVFVQECGAGLVGIRQVPAGLAFAAPPLIRSGPVEEPVAEHIAALLGISRASITDLAWADNGPGWAAVLLPSPEAVLALRPGALDMEIGVAACYPAGSPEAIEVRAFFRSGDATIEDPVTGSLNASLAQWLLDTGRVSVPYVARQGTALGRSGRVHIFREADGQIWVGGGALTCVSGYAEL